MWKTIWGLSPRGRGNQPLKVCKDIGIGSIPAWAGEPGDISTIDIQATVYPRVGGGTLDLLPRPRHGQGLSPRGRGNRNGSTC